MNYVVYSIYSIYIYECSCGGIGLKKKPSVRTVGTYYKLCYNIEINISKWFLGRKKKYVLKSSWSEIIFNRSGDTRCSSGDDEDPRRRATIVSLNIIHK